MTADDVKYVSISLHILYICVCMHVCLYVRTYVRTHARTHGRTHAHTYMHMFSLVTYRGIRSFNKI